MALLIRPLKASEHPQWDEFVFDHPLGTPFHLTLWMRSIQETFGYSPQYLMCTEGDQIRAVLPLFLTKNLLFGKALISSPFAVYGGILADSTQSLDAMRDYLQWLGKNVQVDYIELRNAHPEQGLGFDRLSRHVTFRQEIGPDEGQILNAIPRKTRHMIRKALAEPLHTRVTSDLSRFEDLYARNLRRLGTPGFPSSHFASLRKYFGNMVDVREVAYEGKVAAAVFSFYFRDQVLPYYGASDPAFNSLATSNFMYFDLMRAAGKDGFRVFDFGRSRKESGSFSFKSRWGMEMRELPYEVLLVKERDLPHYSPDNPRFHGAIRLWQRLPLAITRLLGPRLVPFFP